MRNNRGHSTVLILICLLIVGFAFSLSAPGIYRIRLRQVERLSILKERIKTQNEGLFQLRNRINLGAPRSIFTSDAPASGFLRASFALRRKDFQPEFSFPSWSALKSSLTTKAESCLKSITSVTPSNGLASSHTCVEIDTSQAKSIWLQGNLVLESGLHLDESSTDTIVILGQAKIGGETGIGGTKTIIAVGDIEIENLTGDKPETRLSLVSAAGEIRIKQLSQNWNPCSELSSEPSAHNNLIPYSAGKLQLAGKDYHGTVCGKPGDTPLWPKGMVVGSLIRAVPKRPPR